MAKPPVSRKPPQQRPTHGPSGIRPPSSSVVIIQGGGGGGFWKFIMMLLLIVMIGGAIYLYKNWPEEKPIVIAEQPPPPIEEIIKLPEIEPQPEEPPPRPPIIDFPDEPIDTSPVAKPLDKVRGEGVLAIVKPVVNDNPSEYDREAWKIRPTQKKPYEVPRTDIRKMDKIIEAIDNYEGIPVEKTVAHPVARDFPGSVPGVVPRVHYVFSYKPGAGGWRSMGLYAPPGEIITIKLNERHINMGLGLRIGCHADDILRAKKRMQWHRFPRITRSFKLNEESVTVANPFGGLIYITAPGNLHLPEGDLDIKIGAVGVVQAPYYELGKTTREEWAKSKNEHRGPWAELACNGVIVSVPREQIRNLTNPEELMKTWDRIVAEQDWLAGIKDRSRPERIVPDRDISIGWMHSGYPIMCYMASSPSITNLKYLTKEGDWGFFHELGHNHQRGEWTFKGYTEVTNNLFSLLCMERIAGQKPWDRFNKKDVNESLAGLMSNPRIEGPFELLAQYIPVIQEFGWDSLQKTFSSYHTERFSGGGDDERKAEFIVRWSKHCNANIAPYFEKLGFPYTAEMKTQLAGLKEWKPPGFPPHGIKNRGVKRRLSNNESYADEANN
jgi:hypothetical protein